MTKPLPMIEKNGVISYWSQGQQNNYSSVKRILGVVKFPPAELSRHQAAARKKGFNLTVGISPSDLKGSTVPKAEIFEPEPDGAIDRKNGILKTVTADWVVNCVTGKLINRKEARFIGVSSKDGFPYWIHLDQAINDSPVAYPSVFGTNKPAPRKLVLPRRSLEALVSKMP